MVSARGSRAATGHSLRAPVPPEAEPRCEATRAHPAGAGATPRAPPRGCTGAPRAPARPPFLPFLRISPVSGSTRCPRHSPGIGHRRGPWRSVLAAEVPGSEQPSPPPSPPVLSPRLRACAAAAAPVTPHLAAAFALRPRVSTDTSEASPTWQEDSSPASLTLDFCLPQRETWLSSPAMPALAGCALA